jgi:8-oxo-dGTP diphosphatase
MKVVLGYIKNSEDKYLLAKRPINKEYGGFWEFPGGKVENCESIEQAIVREIYEEFNVGIEVKEIFDSYYYDTKTTRITFYPALCNLVTDKVTPTEHSDFQFLHLHEILNLDLAPPDYQALEILRVSTYAK